MKILEVRDGFIKFEADKSIYLSSFIQVDGTEKSYIAQVNQIRNIGTAFLASARILFLYINGGLFNYDKTLPPTDAEIKMFTKDILNNSINAKRPIIIGKTLDNTLNINIDASAFDKKMLVSVDSPNMHNLLIRNFSKQFGNLQQKTIVIDTLGIINAKKYTAGKDFKLPLNSGALNFMYESCLDDATAESKSTIVDIFKELAEYSETVPFVPFETLKSIIDDMVDKQHIFKLLILKNKLAKFEKLGYFASKQAEAANLDKILQSDCAIIDLSKLDPLFQNNYLDYIYEKMNEYKNIQVFLETANTVSKKNLKKIITESKIPTTIVTHSKFKYLNDIKNLFDNFVIEPGITNNEVFSVYSTFLTSMQKNTYLTTGEAINYIPLVSEAQVIDDVSPYSKDKIEEEYTSSVSDTEISDDNITDEEPEFTEDTPEEAAEDSDADEKESLEEETAILEEEQDEIPEPQEEIENLTEDVNLMTNEEAIAVIDKKTDNVIASVSENLEEPGELNLFSDDENFKNSDEPEETIEHSASYQEELTEEAVISDDESEVLEDFEEVEGSEENEKFDVIEDVDSSDIMEVPENDVYEIRENTPTDEFDENSLTEEPTSELYEEGDLSELNENSEMISNIDDELIQSDNEILQSSEDDLSELSSLDSGDNLQEFAENPDDNTDFSEEDLTDNNLQADNLDELSLNDEFEETSVELDNDADMMLDEVQEGQNLTEELPETNIDVDLSEQQVIPVPGEDLNQDDFDELVELDASESGDDDIIVDLSDNNDANELDEEVEQQIMEDVDKVYTTMKNDSSVIEEISDSDLDLIDELNSDGDELEEYTGEELEELSDSQDGIINEIHEETPEKTVENDSGEILEKRDSNTPIVPVYDADIPQEDMVMSDPIQQGDAVMHVKYGNGVVEKMIKYGNKTLFAINFENIGRRLLDPTLTEIKKV